MVPNDGEQRGLIEQQIEGWIRQNVAFPDKLHGACDHVILRHVNVERKPQGDVKSFSIRIEEGAADEMIEPLLHKIADSAQEDADNLSQGVQSYALFAYYPSHKGYVPRKYFRVAPSDVEIQRDLSPSEPPNEKGLVSQMQRHVEAIMRTSTVATGHLFQTLQGENRRLAEMNEKFAQQQIDFMVLMQDLLDNAHGRRLKERSDEASLAMKESAMSKIEAVLPVIINRLAGKPIVPEENRSLMLMATLLESMSETQQVSFYQGLTDPQRVALSEILSEYEQGKSKFLTREKRLVTLGSKNELPPAQTGLPPQPTGSSKSTDILAPVSEILPMPASLSLSERLRLPVGPSSDVKIQQIETDAKTFTNRFRDMLTPPTGDKPK
jgi:hypothetical protein